MKRLIIIGSAFSGGSAQIIDAVSNSDEYAVIGIFDNSPDAIGATIFDVPVISSSDEVESYWRKDFFDEVIIGIGGDLEARKNIYSSLSSRGIPFANIIDKTAQIRKGSSIGKGNVILGNVFIGPSVIVGDNCYIITNTCINHDSKVGSHCYFSAGCTIAGGVTVGERVRFDTASGAKANISISNDSFVPAGHILTTSI